MFSYIDSNFPLADSFSNISCVLNWPVEFKENYKAVRVVLKDNDVENMMSSIEKKNIEILNFSKTRFDFNFDEILSPKQKEILKPSRSLGYYEFPKKINLNCLAEKLNISPSTLCVHLQKIEHKILGSDYSDLFLK
jgi:predicted DNA binding protein